jgi:hypothetical protein
VAAELNDKGFRSRQGNPLSKQSWMKICLSPVYGGLVLGKWTNNQYVRAKFDGPLTPDEWQQLQKVLSGRNTVARKLPRQALHPEFPLRRFLQCPQCGAPVRGYAAVKRNQRRYPYYDCQDRVCGFRVPTALAHKMFVDLLRDVTPTPDLLASFRATVLEVWEDLYRDLNAQGNELQQEVADLRKEKQALFELIKASGDTPALLEQLQRDYERLDRGLQLAVTARNLTEAGEYEAEAVIDTCVAFLKRVSELWEKWPVDLQNRVQVMVLPEGVGYEVLKREANPKLSLVYAVCANPTTLAAHNCRVANRFLKTILEWHKILQALPLAKNFLPA